MASDQDLLEFLYATPVGIARTDLRGTIQLMNPLLNNILMNLQYKRCCFEVVLNKPAKACLSSEHINLLDFFSLYEKDLKEMVLGKLQDNIKNIIKYHDIHVQGHTIEYVRLSCTRLSSGGLVFIVQDITQLKKSELALIESRKALEKSNAMKDKLFSIIAHDLKGPIGALSSTLELMAREPEDFEGSDMIDMIEALQKSSQSIYSLLENLLFWARNQMGDIQYNPEYIFLKQIVSEKLELFQLLAREKGIKITADLQQEKYQCFADKNMVETIIRNLLSNALKFTPRGGRITLGSSMDKTRALVTVRDSGIGMTQEQTRRLFDVTYFASTSGTEGEKGTGLGLRLCKDFVEKNKGKLYIKSEQGRGTAVTFTLPIKAGQLTV